MRTDQRDAGTLADRLRSGPLRSDELEQLAQDLLGMLASLHASGTLHRDLTPATVRLDSTGRLHSSKIGPQRGGTPGDAADVSEDLYACGALLAGASGPDASAPVMVVIGMLTADEPDLRPASATEALSLLGVTSAPPVPRARPVVETSPPAATVPPSPIPVVAPPEVPTEAIPFPPAASFPPVVDSRPVADTPRVEPLPPYPADPSVAEPSSAVPVAADPAGYPGSYRRRPSRRVVLAGVGVLVVALAAIAGALALGGGGDDPAEVPPPAETSLQQQLTDLDGVIDTLGE